MNVFIPQKDTVLQIKLKAQAFIKAYNNMNNDILYPSFPLYAFFDTQISDEERKRIESCTIQEAREENGNFVFPVKIVFNKEGKKENLIANIVFAKHANKKTSAQIPESTNTAQTNVRVFSLGKAELSNNGWKIYDNKWVKCF